MNKSEFQGLRFQGLFCLEVLASGRTELVEGPTFLKRKASALNEVGGGGEGQVYSPNKTYYGT
eukprot:6475169-Amphidinium_carterae.1